VDGRDGVVGLVEGRVGVDGRDGTDGLVAGRVEGRLTDGEGRLTEGRLMDGEGRDAGRDIPPPPRPPRPRWANVSPQMNSPTANRLSRLTMACLFFGMISLGIVRYVGS